MKVIITMAGLGSRFAKAGYNVPKYEIIVKGKTLFEWSILSLKDLFSEEWVFVSLASNKADDFINKTLETYNHNYQIVNIDNVTDGQATTVLKAKDYILPDEPICIYNIDTHIKPYQIFKSDFKGEGFIHLFKAEGKKWSFAKIDEKNKVLDIKEKVVISNYATIGLYYFKSFQLFKELYNKQDDLNHVEKSEKYIAPLYKIGIDQGLRVYSKVIDNSSVIPLGTPEDVEKFKSNVIR